VKLLTYKSINSNKSFVAGKKLEQVQPLGTGQDNVAGYSIAIQNRSIFKQDVGYSLQTKTSLVTHTVTERLQTEYN